MSFKLIAIRPLKGCSARFLKNLEEDRIYKFYNDYSFLDENDNEVRTGGNKITKIQCKNSVPETLYEKSGLDIQISALVGKNGSGKSSLLELLYASCYVIASKKGILPNIDSVSKEIEEIEPSEYPTERNIEFFKDVEKLIPISYQNTHIKINYTTENQKREALNFKKKQIEDIYKELYVEIFYEIEGEYYRILLSPSHSNVEIYNISNNKTITDFKFYNIVINYSMYGLNENILGDWVSDLFHKNDGYQTPIVINPYRREGNIDVNIELHLAQTRLITNILLTDNREILSGKEIDSVYFELDINKNKPEKQDISVKSNYSTFNKVYNVLYDSNNYYLEEGEEKKIPHFEVLMNYVLCKVKKISEIYKEYKDIPPFKGNEISIIFLKKLKEDKSHITLKLRQVLNIIRFNLLIDDNDSKWEKKEDGVLHFELKIDDLIKRIKRVDTSNLKKDELIPIGCYRFIINVKNDTNNNDSVSNINVLSSGEQHLLHTMPSVLYHILNVDSVHSSEVEKIKYEYINIIFDEIELYFHPEYQRRFVFELLERLDSLKKGGNIDNIKGINILFCTHSPFILSDIPKENVLFLGGEMDFKTFGANITTSLASSFFMEYLIGEFAKTKITNIIEKLNRISNDKEDDNNKENILKTIRLIDEPILRNKLIEMYYEKFAETKDKDLKKQEEKEQEVETLAKHLGVNIEIIKQNK
ncbi:AAA family ATPase [Capnocytophaga gingivalis]|jgi:hypothetical protein|uniref:AAA family ATPase n=1 Tax=Capnocytophaga gingivalis TaxID=1017 RepID=UPI002B493BD8|nr:AAA family ATPase [Capnocytophaga gingivalis]MEB3015153.1 AAA family ATPase [Capnocytophaga gingivalis]